MMRIGIISDTHGLLRPDAIKQLSGADHIIHAGDIGAPEVIEGLQRIAPTTAIRGNIDAGEWAKDYSDTEFVSLGGRVVYVLHNLKEIKLDPTASLRQDSGGPGEWCGGLGTVREYELLDGEVSFSHRGERHFSAASGLAGGEAGRRRAR